jgi:probable rRNA maturation factor
MAELNAAYMGEEGPTDVLSFPIEDFSAGAVGEPGGPPLLLGDVIICPSVVRSNAAAAAVAFEDEMALMVVHGILHLLGRDHVVDADAELMEQREREILAMVGRKRP